MSWRRAYDKGRMAEDEFRAYATAGMERLNETSKWVVEDGVVRFKVGPNPFDAEILEEYFDDYLVKYRSGLDRMIYKYCEYHGQDHKVSGFPIRAKQEYLENHINGWQGWDDVHRQAIYGFISRHSPFADPSLYDSLLVLSKLRNTNDHKVAIVPVPEVEIDKGVTFLVKNGSFSVGYHAPVGQDPNKAWNPNDRGAVARFGEFYGVGYESPDMVDARAVVRVRFEANDPVETSLGSIDVLSFMSNTTTAINTIEEDFMNDFSYMF